MDNCVAKFSAKAWRYLGFDKYNKFIYGLDYSNRNIEIIAQSIFGGKSKKLLRSPVDYYQIMDFALGAKQYVGFIINTNKKSTTLATTCIEFWISSVENKTLEKYHLQGPDVYLKVGRYFHEKGLFYSEMWGWIFILYGRLDDGEDDLPVLCRLQLNEPYKTFSLVFLTKCPYSGFVVCHENGIGVISVKFDAMCVYNIKENSWSPFMCLFNEEIYMVRNCIKYIGCQDDGTVTVVTVPSYPLYQDVPCCVFKLINNSWENVSLTNLKSCVYFSKALCSNDLLVVSDVNDTHVVNIKVLSLKDLAFRKVFCHLADNGLSLKDMKNVLDFPTFLNLQYFANV